MVDIQTRELTDQEITDMINLLDLSTPSIIHWALFLNTRAKLIEYFLSQGKTIDQVSQELSADPDHIYRIFSMIQYKKSNNLPQNY